MSDNQDKNDPKLSRGLKIFIIVGTVFLLIFSVVNYATHSGSAEYTHTEIEPDSNLADKELVVKQDTIRKDTAAADSANKEEEEQAKKVYNSIRGNVRHRAADVDNDESDDENQEAADGSSGDATPSEDSKSESSPSSPKQESTPKASPKVENVE